MPVVEPVLRLTTSEATVELKLPEIPTSGHLWRLVDLPSAVRVVDRRFEEAAPGTVGGQGTRVFRLALATPGRHEFIAVLGRAWEKEPVRQRVVVVTASW